MSTQQVKLRRGPKADAVGGAIHEMQARVAAIRLAASTLKDPAVDPQVGAWMLDTAEEEAVRLSTELGGLSALVACQEDESAASPVDVATALRAACELATRSGGSVRFEGSPVVALARPAALQFALPSLVGAVADAGGDVTATVDADDGGAVVRIRRSDDRAIKRSKLVTELLAQIGATPLDDIKNGIAFRLPGGPP